MPRQHYVDFLDLGSMRNKDCRTVVGIDVDCPEKAIGGQSVDCRHPPLGTLVALLACYSLPLVAVPGAMALLLGTTAMNDAAST